MNPYNKKLPFQSIVDELKWPIAISDAEGKYLYANELFCRLRGMKSTEICSRQWWNLVSDEQDRKYEKERWNQIISRGEFVSIVEYQNGTDKKTVVKWDSRVTGDRSEECRYIIERGKVLSSESSEISEKGSYRQEFEEGIVERISDLFRSMMDFGGTVRQYIASDRLKRDMEAKINEISRYKVDLYPGGQGHPRKEERRMLRMDHIVDEIQDYMTRHSEQLIRVRKDARLTQYAVYGSHNQVFEALTRLMMICSRRVSSGKTISVEVKVTDCPEDSEVKGTVVREGEYVEISLEHPRKKGDDVLTNRVFEPFAEEDYILDVSDHHEIHEMVFPLIYQTIKIHGGYIFILPEKARNRFQILFPASKQQGEKKKLGGTPGIRPDSRAGVVMIVDRDPRSRRFIQSVAQGIGFHGITADGKDQALEKYFKAVEKPDLMIIDPFLPLIKDGIDLIKGLKEINSSLRIVLLSAYDREEIHQKIDEMKA